MRGFILAAGFGTRLRPLTNHLPKALVPFAGKPLLAHAISFLESNGITSLGINAHYLPDLIAQFVADEKCDCRLFIEEPDIRGTGGALLFAREFLAVDRTFIVVNADIVTRFDLTDCIKSFEASDEYCRLVAFPPVADGSILYDRISSVYAGTIHDQSDVRTVAADFIGVTLYRREFLSLLTDEDFSIVPVWKRALDQGQKVAVQLIEKGFWRDLGSPAALAQAHFDLIDGVLPPFTGACAQIDRERKCMFPESWSEELKARCASYCWIDQLDFIPLPGSSRIVALPDAVKYNGSNNNGLLYTPWEEIPF